MQKRIKNLLERNSYLIAITITIGIAYLSLSKPIHIETPIKITFLDKILHVSAYFFLTFSWLFTLRNKVKNKGIMFAVFLYGIAMEFLQGWLTNNRQKDIYDVIANSFGILLAMLLFGIFHKYYLKYFDKY